MASGQNQGGGASPIASTDMQFILVDRILELEPGRRIVTAKNLTLAEEYLAEHFPGFPVLPGVLMLESVAQASAWLIRITEDFAHSMVVLKAAKAVRYGNFVTPGNQLIVEARIVRMKDGDTELQAKGTVDGVSAVSGRVVMEAYNLRDREPGLGTVDQDLVGALRRQFMYLGRGLGGTAGQPIEDETARDSIITV